MTLTITGSVNSPGDNPKKRKSGHTKPKIPPMPLNVPWRLRVAHLQTLLGDISHSALYSRLNLGRVPPPDGHDPRPYWKSETIKKFLEA